MAAAAAAPHRRHTKACFPAFQRHTVYHISCFMAPVRWGSDGGRAHVGTNGTITPHGRTHGSHGDLTSSTRPTARSKTPWCAIMVKRYRISSGDPNLTRHSSRTKIDLSKQTTRMRAGGRTGGQAGLKSRRSDSNYSHRCRGPVAAAVCRSSPDRPLPL